MTASAKQLRLAKQATARLMELVEEQEERQFERMKNLAKEQDKLRHQVVDHIEDKLKAEEMKNDAQHSEVSEVERIMQKLSQLSMEWHSKQIEPREFKPLDHSSMEVCKDLSCGIQKQDPCIPTE
jgi:hypothetical protein